MKYLSSLWEDFRFFLLILETILGTVFFEAGDWNLGYKFPLFVLRIGNKFQLDW